MTARELAIREVLQYFSSPTTNDEAARLFDAFNTLADAGALATLGHRLALAALHARRDAVLAEVAVLEGEPSPPKPKVH